MPRCNSLLLTLVFSMALLLACGGQSADTDGSRTYLQEVKPACVELPNSPNPPCARREQWGIDTYPGVHGYFDSEVLSRLPLQLEDEYRMDWGIGDGFGTPQIIVRGTVMPGSTRCSEARAAVFEADRYQVFQRDLGRTDEVCHINVQVNEYIVGRGPSNLPVVAGWRNAVSTATKGYGTATYYQGVAAPIRNSMEGIEFVFDLSISHNLAHADWSFHLHRLWDVQLRPDGTVVGVSWWYGIFGAVAEISDFEYPIAELQKMMRDAHAKLLTENGGRISDEPDSPMLVTYANRENLLAQLRELGAYEVPGITPVPAPPAPIPPVEPGELTALPLDNAGGIPLSWDAPDSGLVSGYKVVRRVPKGEFVTVVADTGSTDTTYTDTSAPMTAGVTYIYRVLALNEYGESLASNRATVELPGPLAPTDFTATNYEGDVVLTWSQPGVIMPSCYRIYRRAQGEPSFEWVVNCWSPELRSWRDDDVVSGTRYIYRIVPMIGSTESGATARASVRVR